MLAPMEGVTHPAFRDLIAERGGVGIVCTEFVRVTGEAMHPSRLAAEVKKSPGVPLSVQVMGNHAKPMAEAAAAVAAAGADVVDINLGCPTPRAVRKGVGAAMLRDEALLSRVLSGMRAAVPGTLSAKMRAGYDDARGAVPVAQLLASTGVDFIVVHPRRRCDFYEGVADWQVVADVKAAVPIPVVGNGDAWYAMDALRLQHETGCDAVMIGRPALRNPWVFDQIAALRAGADPVAPDGYAVLGHIERLGALFRSSGPAAVGKLKEHLRYLTRAVDDGGALRRTILRLPTIDDVMACAERHLAGLGPDALDLQASGHLGLERPGRVSVID
jgi:nifR3 family TIM-barrel protein